MPPPKTLINVSASSAVDLKAELLKSQEIFNREKANGKTVSPAARKPEKVPINKSTVWQRQNKGVGQRADKDRVALEAVETPTLEASRAALERKARIYDKLRKGGSVSEKVAEELMVDFERKNWNDPEVAG
ncbi:hypothetical protein BC938DRAFT_477451 [Jimgerdemannia flammicorona]|uniref:Uncharacterized protein n=1 Tax=Jimgerdemannia flammicorona TaxID=994334 RepID=A0A433P9M2_9FUNG|nr:hypothetical protein BC938DRAFT_477451 [Jimgerdemannia flammicorona]